MEYEQPGDIFVLGAYELNNVRLMLLSGIGEAYNPDTETGVVGRAYTYQGSSGQHAGCRCVLSENALLEQHHGQ
jgi:gluconate 2-dehydrogenase alpha chain